MDTLTTTAYTVALRDCPGLPEPSRMNAEIRYCQALERRLGSADAVATTLRAVIAAQGNDHDDEASATLAMRWRLANMAARQLGLQGLEGVPHASFDVRLGE